MFFADENNQTNLKVTVESSIRMLDWYEERNMIIRPPVNAMSFKLFNWVQERIVKTEMSLEFGLQLSIPENQTSTPMCPTSSEE